MKPNRPKSTMSKTRAVALMPALALLLASSACVKKSTYEGVVSDLGRAEMQRDRLQEELEETRAEMAAALQRRDSIEADLRRRIAVVEGDLTQLRQELRTARDDAQRAERLLGLRGAELQSLQRRLASLQAVEQEVRERNAIYQDVIGRFRSLMDGGQLSVTIDRGRMVIQLPQDILFPSGSATLNAEGRSVISQVGAVLADFEDRRFQVEGHTDNVPISTERFPSNWELSSARALAVVRLLTAQGVAPENVSGAAFGEYQPRASNDDRESRRLNRRIEIVMLPNLDVIASTQVPSG